MTLSILRKRILQMRMRSHPVGLDVWFGQTVRLLPYFLCANSEGSGETAHPEPSLVAYVISTIISWTGSNVDTLEGTNTTTKSHFPKWGNQHND